MTIEDPPWKKRTRPCPFYSQGRCLFADSCNFMHSVKIRRPDSVMGSEDSDQPDFRMAVDSPTSGRAVRFKSPPRSPRTMSLLMALGDVIQQGEEEGEWEEEEFAEQESCSGEESSEGRPSGEYAEPPTANAQVEGEDCPAPVLFPTGESQNSARPTPLTQTSSPQDESAQSQESSLAEDATTLVESFSTRSASPSDGASMLEDEETITRFRRELIPEFPSPPSHVPSPRRDSISSGLLSPIEITPAPPISLPRHAPVTREESFDSGYADGPVPLCLSPPRSPHRMSTLSLLSSPFGSPSARVLRFDPAAAPAAALFSPRFGVFPSTVEHDSPAGVHTAADPWRASWHARSDSVNTLDTLGDALHEAQTGHSTVDVLGVIAENGPPSTSPTPVRHASIPEGSSLFRPVHSPVYPPVDEASLRPGEPSFGEDDTMTSLYDQYYTPTTHTAHLQTPASLEISATTYVGSEQSREPMLEAGPSSPHQDTCLSSPHSVSSLIRRSPPSRQSCVPGSPEFSHHSHSRSPTSRLVGLCSDFPPASEYPRVFSPPLGPGSALGGAVPPESRSPALSGEAKSAHSLAEDGTVHARPEGSAQSTCSTSPHTEDLQSRLISRKVPFGFRHSVSDRSQVSSVGVRNSLTLRIPRVRPPPSVGIGREVEKSERVAVVHESPPSATSSAGPRRLKPLRLSIILNPSSSLDHSIPSATHPPSLTTATTATTAYTPSSPTVSSEYSLSNHRLVRTDWILFCAFP
ncbi:hypothetical protein BD414DRAFT_87962 [Trametes punicea]|nr:hypothetical protein BD414DRAFT_87962 [Trametes punicea]